jgi:hypothetical protein
MPTLVARWAWNQDSSTEPPVSVTWGDGRPATYSDYLSHRLDTHELVETAVGLECRMYPQIEGHVRYDFYAGTWFLTGDGIEETSLSLTDPDATDGEIMAALYELPVVYRCQIHRGNQTSNFPKK